jgi:hypothetical protein
LNLTWDRESGRYRLEAVNDSGVPYVVVMNLATRQGRAVVEGRPIDGAELSEYLNLASRIWAGETYWLLAPYKLRDPGAVLTYGEETTGALSRTSSTFDSRTWGSRREMSSGSTSIAKRAFSIGGASEGGTGGEFSLDELGKFGGILLATERVGATGERILFEDIIVTDSMPDEVFTSLVPVTR